MLLVIVLGYWKSPSVILVSEDTEAIQLSLVYLKMFRFFYTEWMCFNYILCICSYVGGSLCQDTNWYCLLETVCLCQNRSSGLMMHL